LILFDWRRAGNKKTKEAFLLHVLLVYTAVDQNYAYHYATVAYLGGHGAMFPPLWPNHENFLQATLYEKVRFLPFSSKF